MIIICIYNLNLKKKKKEKGERKKVSKLIMYKCAGNNIMHMKLHMYKYVGVDLFLIPF